MENEKSIEVVIGDDGKARIHNPEYDIVIMNESEEEMQKTYEDLKEMARRPKKEDIKDCIKAIEKELLDLSHRHTDIEKKFNAGVQYTVGYAIGTISRVFESITKLEEADE